MYHLSVDITKDRILELVSQEEIFRRYLVLDPVPGVRYRSPLRDDTHPTCGFAYSKSGVLYFRDFSGHFWGDCFDVVQKMYSCSFIQSLNIISKDFDLFKYGWTNRKSHVNGTDSKLPRKKVERKLITYSKREWTADDTQYWGQYNLNLSRIENRFRVEPASWIYIGGEPVYGYSPADPAYVYNIGGDARTAYFPKRPKSRFLTNHSYVQGLSLLPETGNLCVITKSYKDVMCFDSLGLYAVAPQGEGNRIDSDLASNLAMRFSNIVILYDFDYTGVRGANTLRRRSFGMLPNLRVVFLTNGRFGTKNYGAKDFSDYLSKFGVRQAEKFITDQIDI